MSSLYQNCEPIPNNITGIRGGGKFSQSIRRLLSVILISAFRNGEVGVGGSGVLVKLFEGESSQEGDFRCGSPAGYAQPSSVRLLCEIVEFAKSGLPFAPRSVKFCR